MGKLLLTLLIFSLMSCNVEERIKDHSYTEKWYYEKNERYQVYKTKKGNYYIIVLNKKQTNLKRKYINL